MNRQDYIEQIALATEEVAWAEIRNICINAKVDPQKYLVFKDTGGFSWVITHLAADLFLSSEPFNDDVRFCLTVMNLANHISSCPTLFAMNARLLKANGWNRERLEVDVIKLRKQFVWSCVVFEDKAKGNLGLENVARNCSDN